MLWIKTKQNKQTNNNNNNDDDDNNKTNKPTNKRSIQIKNNR